MDDKLAERWLQIRSFERSEQMHEYIDALRNRVFSLKFAYIGQAARSHDRLMRSREYGLADAEASLIRAKFAQDILALVRVPRLNVVDVGAGNGVKACLVLSALAGSVSGMKYTALDYSSELLTIAERNIRPRFPNLTLQTGLIDFEASPFGGITARIREETGVPCLLLLLGHTLGNPLDHVVALSNISRSMGDGDSLLVGLEMFQANRVDAILSHYQNDPFRRVCDILK